jgi:UDP-glucose:glycoprotein glucosyltransferase
MKVLTLLLTQLLPAAVTADKTESSLKSLSSFTQEYSHTIPTSHPPLSSPKRNIQTSVSAHSWPTTIFSPLCETFAYLDKSSSLGNKENEEKNVRNENSWNYLDGIVKRGGIPALDDWVLANIGSLDDACANNEGGSEATCATSNWSYDNSTQLAIQSAFLSNNLDKNLLPLVLSLRAYAPTCEMYRSLSRDAAISFRLYHPESGGSVPAAFAILSRVTYVENAPGKNDTVVLGSEVLLDVGDVVLDNALEVLEKLSKSASDDEAANTERELPEQTPLLLPLPGETYHPEVVDMPDIMEEIDYDDFLYREKLAEWNEVKDETIAILYGQIGTTAFGTFYKALKARKVKFVVRHMGHVAYEEEVQSGQQSLRAIPTALQGYGVRLDIRNVEYKAFDDGQNEKDGDETAAHDWNDSMHDPKSPARNEYLAGINLHKVMGRFDKADTAPLPEDLQALQTALLQSHPAQTSSESIVPPAWKRRSLSLQAATVITQSSDSLKALQGISQNLPSVAHALTSIHVEDTLKSLAQEATDLSEKVGAVSPGWGDAPFGFYINAREVNVERPSFNIFQLLDVIREEDKKLRDLESDVRPMLEGAFGALMGEGRGKGTAFKVLKDIRRGIDMGVERLIEFGKEKNNVEGAEEGGMMLDGPAEPEKKPRIDVGRGGKKAVVYLNDLEKDPEYQSWPRVEEMMMRMQFGQGFAARRNLFTMLIVLDPTSGNAHPAINIMTQLVNGQFPVRIALLIVGRDDIANKEASKPGPFDNGNRPFHPSDALVIIKYISKKYGGMAAISALANGVFQPTGSKVPTVKEYISSYVSVLSQMGVVSPNKETFIQQEIQLLLTFPEEDDDRYQAAFDFATKKLLKPGKLSS